jgi:hypothetical protein
VSSLAGVKPTKQAAFTWNQQAHNGPASPLKFMAGGRETTGVAEEVVSQYRAVIGERLRPDDQPSTPFFDREHTPVDGFARFVFAEDPRPRASN